MMCCKLSVVLHNVTKDIQDANGYACHMAHHMRCIQEYSFGIVTVKVFELMQL